MTQNELICHETRAPLPFPLTQGLVGAARYLQARGECNSLLDILTFPKRKKMYIKFSVLAADMKINIIIHSF